MLSPSQAIKTLLIVVLANSVTLTMVSPMLPLLLQKIESAGPAETSRHLGLLLAAYAGFAAILGPLLGSLSDRYGRRPVLLIALGGSAVDQLIAAAADSFLMLMFARAFAGACGACAACAFASAADLTAPQERAKNFGLIGGAFSAGYVVGPGIGGILGRTDPHLPFIVAAALSVAVFVFAALFLRESLPVERRSHDKTLQMANPIGALVTLVRTQTLRRVLGIFLLLGTSISIVHSTLVLYVQTKLGWNAFTIGLALTLLGVFSVIVQSHLPRITVVRFGEQGTLFLGIAALVLANSAFAVSTSNWHVFATMPLLALGMLAGIAMQTLASKEVPDSEQGRLQGSLSSVGAVTSLFGPLIGTSAFAFFAHPRAPIYLPSAAFLLAIGLLVCSAVLASQLGRARTPSLDATRPTPE